MSWIAAAAIVLGTIAAMEAFAWWAHKHIMHGWGWAWHESHHRPREGWFEKNDLYSVVFAGFSILLFLAGSYVWAPLWWVALGITCYGILYYLAHDGLVHQRWPFRYHPNSGYLRRLVEAHHLHHAVHTREGCVSFGFVYAPDPDRLRAELKANRRARLDADAA